MNSKTLLVTCSLLLCSCASAPPMIAAAPQLGAAPAASGIVPRNQIVPLLDAHQHMMGPAAMSSLQRDPPPPPIEVPAAVADLLRAREKVDDTTYDRVFTTNAQLFAEEQGRWWIGKAHIADSVGNFGSDHRFVPTSVAIDGNAGYVAGTLKDADGKGSHEFVLGLLKTPGGQWRIASEMKQRIMPPLYAPVIDAEKIIEVLDDAGIRKATVLSVAYWFGDPGKHLSLTAQETGTRAENDWVIAQTQKYPDRLMPFCGVNPVADYAIAELERCAAIPAVRGMKIHRNSKFDVETAHDLERLKAFFRAANKHKMAIVVHLRGDPKIWIDSIFPEAPDVPIQVAHMGSGWSNTKIFADAIQAGKAGTANLWFDWTQALPIEGLWGYGPSEGLAGKLTPEDKAEVVGIMRRIGLGRILYGTDMPLSWNPTPREWWRKTILTLPLSDDEIRDIADNVPPYAR